MKLQEKQKIAGNKVDEDIKRQQQPESYNGQLTIQDSRVGGGILPLKFLL